MHHAARCRKVSGSIGGGLSGAAVLLTRCPASQLGAGVTHLTLSASPAVAIQPWRSAIKAVQGYFASEKELTEKELSE